MNILLLNDTSNWYHFGCTATSTALIEGFLKRGHKVNSLPISKTYEISSSPDTKRGFLDQKVYLNFINKNQELIKSIQCSDALVINGEGTLHGIKQGPLNLLYTAYIAKTKFKKHVEIVNHSVYPQNDTQIDLNKEEAIIYSLVYNILDFIAIREPLSLATMEKLSIKAVSSFDCMPVYISDHYIKHNNKSKDVLLISGSATWLQFNIATHENNAIKYFSEGLKQLNIYIDHMIERGFKVEFLIGANANGAEDDIKFIEYMEEVHSTKWQIYEATSLNDWLYSIEKAALLVSGRFHHTIAASCLGTPFISFASNTPKIDGLAQLLNYTDILHYNDNDIYDKLKQLTDTALQTNISQDFLNELCLLAKNNFDGLGVDPLHESDFIL
jgi:polysaccharide pyruvyl transferase WcaK-like protein